MNFIKQTFTNFKTTGAIMSIRRNTAKQLVNLTEVHKARFVVEFGPGTGKITEELLKHLPIDGLLFLVECNPEFVKLLERKFYNEKRVIVIDTFAQDFNPVKDLKFDLVVNSIPMSLISENIRLAIYQKAKDILKTSGTFVQYQYTKKCLQDLRRIFPMNIIEHTFTFTNIIPTYLFRINMSK